MIAAISDRHGNSTLALALLVAAGLSWPTATQAQQLSGAELEELTEQQFDAALALYREFLSLPNDAHFPDDMRVIVDWLDSAFRLRGFATRELPTAGVPLLLREVEHRGVSRTLRLSGIEAWVEHGPLRLRVYPLIKNRTVEELPVAKDGIATRTWVSRPATLPWRRSTWPAANTASRPPYSSFRTSATVRRNCRER